MATLRTGIKVLYDPAEQAGGSDPPLDESKPRVSPAEVDIVFIHGLTGHRERTWSLLNPTNGSPSLQYDTGRTETGSTSGKSSKRRSIASLFRSRKEKKLPEFRPWPPALLPEYIPNARLLTWGYDADVAKFMGTVSTNTIFNHAKSMLRDLVGVRREAEERPIIFVGHSLGGIVIKDQDDLRRIARATHSVVFLGTPHRGSGAATLGNIVSNVAGLVLVDANKRLLKELKPDSATLERVTEYFSIILKKDEVKIVDWNSSYIGDTKEGKDALHANHRDMPKFRDKEDPNFKKLRDVLQNYVKEARLKAVGEEKKQIPDSEGRFPSGADEKGKGRETTEKAIPTDEIEFDEVVNFPPDPRTDFFGRESQLAQIKEELVDKKKDQNIAVLWGLGGIGKTRLAIEFAKQNRGHFTTSFWVDFRSSETCATSFGYLAISILFFEQRRMPKLPLHMQAAKFNFGSECSADDNNIPVASERTIKGVLKYIERSKRTWLLVFDSYEDEGLDLIKYFPASTGGNISILVSTRNRAFGEGIGSLMEIPSMETTDASALLLSRIQSRPSARFKVQSGTFVESETEKASKIVDLLAGIPLAVEQAGRYINRCRIPLDRFPEIYETKWRQLLDTTVMAPKVSYEKNLSVYRMLSLTFQDLQDTSEECGNLLFLLSFYDSKEVRLAELCSGASSLISTFPDGSIASVLVRLFRDDSCLLEALETIFDYCMAYEGYRSGSCGIHSLVQNFLQDVISEDARKEMALLCAELLAVALHQDHAKCRPYRSWLRRHVYRVYSHLSILDALESDTSDRLFVVYEEFAVFFEREKDLLKAKAMYLGVIETALVHQKDHGFEYRRSLENLARMMSRLGEHASAEEAIVAALTDKLESLDDTSGADDEDAARLNTVLQNIRGQARQSSADLDRALGAARIGARSPKRVLSSSATVGATLSEEPHRLGLYPSDDFLIDESEIPEDEWALCSQAITMFDVAGVASEDTFVETLRLFHRYWVVNSSIEGLWTLYRQPELAHGVGMGECVHKFTNHVARYHWESRFRDILNGLSTAMDNYQASLGLLVDNVEVNPIRTTLIWMRKAALGFEKLCRGASAEMSPGSDLPRDASLMQPLLRPQLLGILCMWGGIFGSISVDAVWCAIMCIQEVAHNIQTADNTYKVSHLRIDLPPDGDVNRSLLSLACKLNVIYWVGGADWGQHFPHYPSPSQRSSSPPLHTIMYMLNYLEWIDERSAKRNKVFEFLCEHALVIRDWVVLTGQPDSLESLVREGLSDTALEVVIKIFEGSDWVVGWYNSWAVTLLEILICLGFNPAIKAPGGKSVKKSFLDRIKRETSNFQIPIKSRKREIELAAQRMEALSWIWKLPASHPMLDRIQRITCKYLSTIYDTFPCTEFYTEHIEPLRSELDTPEGGHDGQRAESDGEETESEETESEEETMSVSPPPPPWIHLGF